MMIATVYKQVVYPGDGASFKPDGAPAKYSMYSPALPTQASLAEALGKVQEVLTNTGYQCRPEFVTHPDKGIMVMLAMSNWMDVPVEDPIDLGALMSEANARSDAPAALAAGIHRWLAKHAREEQAG
jgi:hypothetical protein